jgi:hypothetical protein
MRPLSVTTQMVFASSGEGPMERSHEGIIDDLQVVDVVAGAEDGVACAVDVVDKAHAPSEV